MSCTWLYFLKHVFCCTPPPMSCHVVSCILPVHTHIYPQRGAHVSNVCTHVCTHVCIHVPSRFLCAHSIVCTYECMYSQSCARTSSVMRNHFHQGASTCKINDSQCLLAFQPLPVINWHWKPFWGRQSFCKSQWWAPPLLIILSRCLTSAVSLKAWLSSANSTLS